MIKCCICGKDYEKGIELIVKNVTFGYCSMLCFRNASNNKDHATALRELCFNKQGDAKKKHDD